MKCDELQRHSIRGVMYNGEEICGGFAYYDSDEVDEAIAELKAAHHKERHEYINMIAELNAQKAQAEDDCAFWKNKYNDCKRELDLLKDTNAFYNGERNERT